VNNHPVSRTILVILLLVVATSVVYWRVGGNEFVNYDDNLYLYDNPNVKGLTLEHVRWAFTTDYAVNWHPLTWISHMVDFELFGLNPAGHHLVGLLIHVLNSVLLFLVLTRATSVFWPSAFVAALFALHPFHVESVAWASERKDLLAALFWILTMWAYVRYTESRGITRYVLMAFCFALGLMSKPMLVTLPFTLLLLDVWPLRRLVSIQSMERTKGRQRVRGVWSSYAPVAWRLVREKIPLFLMVAGSSYITFTIQQQVAMKFGSQFSLPIRLGNAVVSYAEYVWKTIWPSGLSILYVHRGVSPEWQVRLVPAGEVALAGALLVAITVIVVVFARRSPYLPVGWLWFVGTLIPVIGIVQVGEQAMADRYTYIPHIGLFVMMVWGVAELAKSWRLQTKQLAIAGTLVLAVYAVVAWQQVGYWKNSVTLFERAVSVNPINPVAYYNIGHSLSMQGRYDEAIPRYEAALRIVPHYTEAQSMLQSALQVVGRTKDLARARWTYGTAVGQQGKLDEAIANLTEAVRLDPGFAAAHNDLGTALAVQGRIDEARDHFAEAVRLDPSNINARYNLGLTLERAGRLEEAAQQFEAALRLKTDYPDARIALDRVRRANPVTQK
jgi:Tfp pilus assembly protein PilF